MLAEGRGGLFNTVGPGRSEPLGNVVVAAALAAAGGRPDDVQIDWVDETGLGAAIGDIEEEARPLWFPEPQAPRWRSTPARRWRRD